MKYAVTILIALLTATAAMAQGGRYSELDTRPYDPDPSVKHE